MEEIRNLREDSLTARRKMAALIETASKEIGDPDIINFCQKVEKFFFFSNLTIHDPNKKSHSEYLIELLDLAVKGELQKNDLSFYINKTLKNLDKSYGDLARSYAMLRIHCLKNLIR